MSLLKNSIFVLYSTVGQISMRINESFSKHKYSKSMRDNTLLQLAKLTLAINRTVVMITLLKEAALSAQQGNRYSIVKMFRKWILLS